MVRKDKHLLVELHKMTNLSKSNFYTQIPADIDIETKADHIEGDSIGMDDHLKLFKWHLFPQMLFFGRTLNNIKQLDFISNLLSKRGLESPFAVDLLADEYSNIEAESERQDMNDRFRNLSFNLGLEDVISPIRIRSFFRGYAQVYLSVKYSKRLPKLAFFANDHNPWHLGAKSACEDLGVKTAYLQHAPISERFPALNYDLAVLSDYWSKERYLAVGETNTEIFVLRRLESAGKSNNGEANLKKRSLILPIVIYLTRFSQTNEGVMRAMIESLRAKWPDREIVLSLHPQDSNEVEMAATTVSGVLDREHIAIVGNSGISIELIREGVHCFYAAKLDKLPKDYYGLVSSGIIREIDDNLSLIENFGDIPNKQKELGELLNQSDQEFNRQAEELFLQLKKMGIN